jgi:hypothetical protein
MNRCLLVTFLFIALSHLLFSQERRLGKLAGNSWSQHEDLGANRGEFAPSVNYPDFGPVGALTSISTGVLGTATLVAPNVAITAAHVIKNSYYDALDPSDWQFTLGPDRTDINQSLIFQVERIEIHSGWTSLQTIFDPNGTGDFLGVDLALVHLDENVTDFYPAMLPQSSADEPLGQRTVMAGFGSLVEGVTGVKNDTNFLRVGGENIIDRSIDSSDTSSELMGGLLGADFDSPSETSNTLAQGQIVDELGDGNSSSTPLPLEASTAVGDSGGPAFVLTSNQWRIHGVVSYGTNSSMYGDITVFTRLASHLDWIKERLPNWPGSRFIDQGNWRQNSWFGIFYPFQNNWIYHVDHGWNYAPDAKGDFFWSWNSLLESWLWVHADAYPWVYSVGEPPTWQYIDIDTSTPVRLRIYDETNGWFYVDQN